MGVSYKRSHQWQRLGDVPDDKFEEALAVLDRPSRDQVIDYAGRRADSMMRKADLLVIGFSERMRRPVMRNGSPPPLVCGPPGMSAPVPADGVIGGHLPS